MRLSFISKSIILGFCIFLCGGLFGCKKIGNATVKKLAKETTEETIEAATKKVGKKGLQEIGEKGIKKLNFDGFLKQLKQEFPLLFKVFSNLDGSLQRQVFEAMKNHPKFFERFFSSKGAIEEFIKATSKTPVLAKDIRFFKHFVIHPEIFDNIALRQTEFGVDFLSKDGTKLLGKYKNGVMEIAESFPPDTKQFDNMLLRSELMPSTLYKMKGEMGKSITIQTDEIGKALTVEAKGLNPNDIITKIIRRNDDVNLGEDWSAQFKKIKQYSKGNDIDISIRYKYDGKNPNPKSLIVEAKQGDKKIFKENFDNLNHLVPKKYTPSENIALVNRLKDKLRIPEDKVITLTELMNTNDGFTAFIRENPEYQIRRWLKTRNHVDERLLAKTPKGKYVPNGKVYAGNTYYLNPYLNPGLEARLKNKNGLAELKKAGILTREDLLALDKQFPNGIPFDKRGFPDFSNVAFRDKEGKAMLVDIGQLSGNSKTDIAAAESKFLQMGYPAEKGWTWHHVEGTTKLMRVPSNIHQLVDHAGAMAMMQ